MTKNILKTALVVLGAGTLMTGCDLEQPEAPCFVQDSPSWAVKYDLVQEPRTESGAACEIVPPSAEPVGVFKFVNPDDPSATRITLRPAGLASRAGRDPGPSSAQTATGKLVSVPDAEQFCSANEFTIATVSAAATATSAATTVTYEYSNVRVYSAPSSPGTQFTGELKYTRDGCTSTYVMRALWPALPCDPDSEIPAEKCGEGSGLNPDFAAECDAAVGICVPSKAIPSFVDAAD